MRGKSNAKANRASFNRRRLLRPWIILFLVSITIQLEPYEGASQSDCEKAAPLGWSKGQRQRLCSNATGGNGPALCAQRSKDLRTGGSISTDVLIDLCQGASGIGPAECLYECPRSMNTATKLLLCGGAEGIGPAACVKEAPRRLTVETKVELCQGASNSDPAKCMDLFPKRLGMEIALQMCKRGEGQGPAQCALARGMDRQSPELLQSLCEGARSDAPALCYDATPATMSAQDKVKLCRRASSIHPALCASSVTNREISPTLLIDLCRSAESVAPARCLSEAPHSLPIAEKVLLCKGAVDTSPAACLHRASSVLREGKDRVALCQGATSIAPATCAAEAPFAMAAVDKVHLCRGVSTSLPAQCAQAAARSIMTSTVGWAPVLQLCHSASSTEPAACLAAAPNQQSYQPARRPHFFPYLGSYTAILSLEARIRLCSGISSASGPAMCAHRASRSLPEDLVVGLCRHASNSGPMECVRAAQSNLSPSDLLLLCHGAQGEIPAQCLRESPPSLPPSLRAQLCAGSPTLLPAHCARIAPTCLSPQQLIALCQGASSFTPGYCASRLLTCSLSQQDLFTCRTAVSKPTYLRTQNLTHEGLFLQPGVAIQAQLLVLDQFEQHMTWANKTMVYTYLHKPYDAVLEGKKVNESRQGVVELNGLAFREAGTYTLHFSLLSPQERLGIGDGSSGGSLASARVVVLPTADEQRRLDCLFLFDLIQDLVVMPQGEVFGMMVWPDVMASASCLSAFESSGFKIEWGWSGDLWIWYSTGVYVLETGVGVPTARMSYWQRLDLEPGASPRDVRRAYYHKSLEWHPDRWAKYPAYVGRAKDVFELVSEAYVGLHKDFRSASASASASASSASTKASTSPVFS